VGTAIRVLSRVAIILLPLIFLIAKNKPRGTPARVAKSAEVVANLIDVQTIKYTSGSKLAINSNALAADWLI